MRRTLPSSRSTRGAAPNAPSSGTTSAMRKRQSSQRLGARLALHHHRHRGSRRSRKRARGVAPQVFLEIAMVGNLAEKSLARWAILTATWRATLL